MTTKKYNKKSQITLNKLFRVQKNLHELLSMDADDEFSSERIHIRDRITTLTTQLDELLKMWPEARARMS